MIPEKVGTDHNGHAIFEGRNVMGSTIINYMQDLMQCIKDKLQSDGADKWKDFLMCLVQVSLSPPSIPKRPCASRFGWGGVPDVCGGLALPPGRAGSRLECKWESRSARSRRA